MSDVEKMTKIRKKIRGKHGDGSRASFLISRKRQNRPHASRVEQSLRFEQNFILPRNKIGCQHLICIFIIKML